MAMFPSYGKSRFEIAFVFPSVDGTIMSARHGEKLFQGIDGSISSTPDPHKMHSGPMARNSMLIQRWSSM